MGLVLVGLEAWLLAAVVAAAKPGQEADAPPPIELLEFLGDWTTEEQKLIDQASKPKKKPVKTRERKKDVGDEAAETRSGPPR